MAHVRFLTNGPGRIIWSRFCTVQVCSVGNYLFIAPEIPGPINTNSIWLCETCRVKLVADHFSLLAMDGGRFDRIVRKEVTNFRLVMKYRTNCIKGTASMVKTANYGGVWQSVSFILQGLLPWQTCDQIKHYGINCILYVSNIPWSNF